MITQDTDTINPLQDATEALRVAFQDLDFNTSLQLRKDAPGLCDAILRVVEVAGTDHIDPPVLTEDERHPADVPSVGLYDGAVDARPYRQLKDVWEGKGDFDDPLIPEDEHEHRLVLERLRSDPEAEWHTGG